MNDIGDRKPDLILFELPLTNDLGGYKENNMQGELGYVDSFVWGTNETGWKANSNLKTLSNNWADFECLIVIPHIGSRFISSINKDNFLPMRYKTSYQIWQRYKHLISTHNDVSYIDIDNMLIQEARFRKLTMYDAFYYDTSIGADRRTSKNHSVMMMCILMIMDVKCTLNI